MIKVKYTYSRGWNDTVEEIVEFDDDTTDEEIQDEFVQWVWEIIGDKFGWGKI